LAIVPPTYKLLSVASTAVTVIRVGNVERTMTEPMKLFADPDVKQPLTYKPTGEVTAKWIGYKGQLLVEDQEVSVVEVPRLADISYPFAAVQYRITSPPGLKLGLDEKFPIGIVLYVEEIPK
jgi:hypothetical protein